MTAVDKEFFVILSKIRNSPEKIETLLVLARQLLCEQEKKVNRNA